MVIVGIFMIGNRFPADIANVIVVVIRMVGNRFPADIADMVIVVVRMIGNRFPADIADMVIVGIFVIGNCFPADIANMVIVGIFMIGNHFPADIAQVILVVVGAFREHLVADVALVIFVIVRVRLPNGIICLLLGFNCLYHDIVARSIVTCVPIRKLRPPFEMVSRPCRDGGGNVELESAVFRGHLHISRHPRDSIVVSVGVKLGSIDFYGVEIEPLVILIHNLRARVVRREIRRVIRAVSIGKHDRIAGACGGNADGRTILHRICDGQRLAGGQIHIVLLPGNRVVFHNGRAAEVQFAGIGRIDINAAAVSARRISADLAPGKVAGRSGAVNIHAAAVAGGRIAGDFAVRHVQNRRFLIQINRAAVPAGVSGDLAAAEVEGAVRINQMNRAALFRGSVAADLAAGHVERRLLVRIFAQADCAAPAGCRIAGQLCVAGNVDGSPSHQDRAAVQAGRVAGNHCVAGNVDRPAAAHIDRAAAGIVAVHGRCISEDRAAFQVDRAAGGGEERTAVFRRVILDDAAVHIKSAAGGVRLVCIEFPENRTAIIVAVVAGNLAAVHIEYAQLVIQRDGTAAATFGDFSAGELAAE